MGNYENLKQSITEVIRTNGNKEITGAVLQSTLLTIISTVGANATFAGIAIPTTNPGTPDGSVFYLASEAGIYANFGNIELQNGLSVLILNGSSWSSQQIFGVDDVPTAGSDNLVKSGGVQEELALGAVYDVSAKNPTAGVNNDGKFESLSALFEDANLDTLIPVSVRKGGMSVKFVQSSDNNYIQARLMANSFTTDITKWQTVDKKPVSGSNNLVESGGVDADLYNLEKEVFNTTTQELVSASNIMVGYSLKSDGQALNTGVQQQKLTNFINIENIDILNIKMCFPQNTDYAGIAFYSSNTEASFICSSRLSDGELPTTWLYYEGTIQIPSGAKYIRVQGFSGSGYPSAVAINVSSTSKINEINNTQLRFTFNGACSIVGNKCIIAQIPILVTQQIDGSKKGYFIQQGIYELSDNFTYLVAETSGKSSGETIIPQIVSAENITKSTFIIAAKNNGKVVCYTPMDNNNVDGKQLEVIDPTSAQSFTRKAVLGVDGVMQVISGGNDNWKVSDYIYIDDALEISFVFRAFSPTNNTYAGICFYSSNNEESFISYDNSYDGTDSESGWKYGISPVTIPSGAKYMRVAGFDMILPGSPYIGINKLTVKDRTLDYFLGNSRKILYVGDSITDTHYIPYAYPFIIEKITEAENINYAVASSGYAGDATGNHKIWGQQDTKVFNMIERAYETGEKPNIIIMAAGTNDWDFSRPYGSIEDISQETMDNPTFYWYVAKAIKTAINRFYYSTFLVITPLPRLQNGRNQHTKNSVGKTLVDYSNAIKEVCDYYSVPYLDMTVESNMHLENQVAVNLYTANYLDNDEPDGLHPSKFYYYHFYTQKVLEKLRGLVR